MAVPVPPRVLTPWEAAVITQLLDGPALDADPAAREAWRCQLTALRVVGTCDCRPGCALVTLELLDGRLRVVPAAPEYRPLCEGYLAAHDVAAVREGEIYAAVEEYLLFQKGGVLTCLDACLSSAGPAPDRVEPPRVRFWQHYEQDTAPAQRE